MRLTLGAIVLSLAGHLAAGAGEPAPRLWIQGKGALIRPYGCDCLQDAAGAGAGFGGWISPRWGAEVDYLALRLKGRDSDAASGEQHLAGALLFNLAPAAATWKPYLRAGLGASRIQSPFSLAPDATTRLAGHAGLGLQAALGRQGLASLELRTVTVNTSARHSEFQALAGLGFRIGPAPRSAGGAAPPEPAPAPMPAPPPAPAPAPPPAPPPAPEAPVPAQAPPPSRIVLDEAMLHFADDSAVLPPAGVAQVRKVAASLRAFAGTYRIRVTGHTSGTGGRLHNLALSLRRAAAVARVLADAGLPPGRIRTAGLGPDRPVASNATPAGRARNRRVEIEVQAAGVERRRTETEIQDN